jgi:hypothetical protein
LDEAVEDSLPAGPNVRLRSILPLDRLLSLQPSVPSPTIATGLESESDKWYPFYANAIDGGGDPGSSCFVSAAGYDTQTPRLGQAFKFDAKRESKAGMTLREALRTPHAAEFAAAARREQDKMLKTGSLKVVRYHASMGKPLNSRHVCSIKPDKPGSAAFDARLCIQGFAQRPDQYDPDRVSTPVCRSECVKMSLAWHAGTADSQVRVVDGERAFLQAALTKHDGPMHISIPEGWDIPVGYVLEVVNSVYGLKQSCFNWCEKLDNVLIGGNLIPFLQDPRSFVLFDQASGKKTFVHAHVDDVKIVGQQVDKVCLLISKHIVIKDQGPRPRKFCGLEFEYGQGWEFLIHMKFTVQSLVALREACGVDLGGMAHSSTPMLPGVAAHLLQHYAPEANRPPTNDRFYRAAIGVLNYLEGGVRADISYPFSVLSTAVGRNTQAHDDALLRLVMFIKGTEGHGLVYGANHASSRGFKGFMDSSFADAEKAKSTQGHVIKFNDCLVKWSARRQPCVALDTMEAEYISASSYCRVLLGLLNVLMDMLMEHGPVPSYEDNTAAEGLITLPLISRGARHINVRYHMVRELQQRKIIDCRRCTTDQQQADCFTKALDVGKFQRNIAALGIMSITEFHRRFG